MFGWILTGDNLSQLHHQYQKASRTQRLSGDNLTYQKKTLEKRTTNKKFGQEFHFSQPKCSKIHHNTCAAIEQHNRHRRDTIHIERKLQTKTWDNCVATSIFVMYFANLWLMYRGCNTDSLHTDPQLNQQ